MPTLRALIAAGHQVVKVVTQPDRPAGRGRAMTPTPTALAAESLGLSVVRTSDINALNADGVSIPAADAMVVIAFGQKLDESVIHKPRLGTINLHASRLPKYRGAAPINWSIIEGDATTGNSVIRLAQKMDAGAILAQSELTINDLETAGELHDRLALDGAPLVLEVLAGLARGAAIATEQDHSKATVARKLSRDAARIDWSLDAQRISRQIRGMYPWPGCRVELLEGDKILDVLTLVRGRPAPPVLLPFEPGTLIDSAQIAAGGGRVEVIEVQPAGKRPMPIDAYLRGHQWNARMRCRSI